MLEDIKIIGDNVFNNELYTTITTQIPVEYLFQKYKYNSIINNTDTTLKYNAYTIEIDYTNFENNILYMYTLEAEPNETFKLNLISKKHFNLNSNKETPSKHSNLSDYTRELHHKNYIQLYNI